MTPAKKSNNAQIREIPIGELRISPSESRKTIDQDKLRELAASIAANGVLEALIVRPVDLDCMSGDPLPGSGNVPDAYEIVSGQRRFEASKLAGKTTCPCIVRELTDEEAREQAIIPNVQREDLPPMEEAEAYGKLLDEPGETIETVAAKLAKSPSYVGRRVQLLKAIEPVRQALKAGAIEVGHALELARLDEAGQRRMLTRMQCGATLVEPQDVEDEDAEAGVCRFCGCSESDACRFDGGGNCSWANDEETVCTNPDCLEAFRGETGQEKSVWQKTHYSVVELRREIAEAAHCDLKDAPFPLDDELPPMACTECPKRAGNAQLLFDDCAQDTCTDRACFYRKVNAWIAAELEAAAGERRKLLELTESYNAPKGKVRCSQYDGARVLKATGECAHGEEGIWIDGRNAGRRATVCRKQDCKTHFGRSSNGGSSLRRVEASPKEQAERKELLAKVRVEKEYRLQLFKDLMGRPVDPVPTDEMVRALVVFAMGRFDSTKHDVLSETLGWPKEFFGWQRESSGALARLMEYSQAQLLLIALVGLEANELTVHEHDVDRKNNAGKKREIGLERVAKLFGVDAAAIRERVNPSAKKSVPKQGDQVPAKTPLLSAEAKKRIADAQKKRWADAKKASAKAAPKKAAKPAPKKAAAKPTADKPILNAKSRERIAKANAKAAKAKKGNG